MSKRGLSMTEHYNGHRGILLHWGEVELVMITRINIGATGNIIHYYDCRNNLVIFRIGGSKTVFRYKYNGCVVSMGEQE